MRPDLAERWRQYTMQGYMIPWHLLSYRPEYDYVGPDGSSVLRRATPNYIYRVDINYAGFIHDRLYEMGGNEADRAVADREFLANILGILREKLTGPWLVLLPMAYIRALGYYSAVKRLGRSSFNYRELQENHT